MKDTEFITKEMECDPIDRVCRVISVLEYLSSLEKNNGLCQILDLCTEDLKAAECSMANEQQGEKV
jgi:hypothetical protein